jgi:hypothetical protein
MSSDGRRRSLRSVTEDLRPPSPIAVGTLSLRLNQITGCLLDELKCTEHFFKTLPTFSDFRK